MPKKNPDRKTPPPGRARKRTKQVVVDEVPKALTDLPDEAMQKAAMALAKCGYKKGSRRRNGAVIYASQVADVSRETIYNWIEDPAFDDAVQVVNSMLVAKCLEGLEACIPQGDVRAIVELLGLLDPEMDRTWLREQAKMAHDERMRRLDIELASLQPENDAPLPAIVFYETPPGERRTPEDETQH